MQILGMQPRRAVPRNLHLKAAVQEALRQVRKAHRKNTVTAGNLVHPAGPFCVLFPPPGSPASCLLPC